MNWTDCAAAWKRQEVPAASAAEVAALEASFESRRRQMASARRVRNLIEGSAGPVVALCLAILWWTTGRSGWATALAILLILAGSTAVFGAAWLGRIRARRSRPGADAPLLIRVDTDIADLQRERRQLLTMRTWSFAPVYAAVLLIPFVFILKRYGVSFPIAFSGYYAAVVLLASVHNRREVRKRLDPRLDELERLRRGLAPGDGPAPSSPRRTAG